MPHTFQKTVGGADTYLVLDGTIVGQITVLNPHATEDVYVIGNDIYSSTSISTAITSQGFKLKATKALSFRIESNQRLWARSVTGTQTINICIFQTGNPVPHNHG